MADITKNSFSESQRHQKVIFQRGRDVTDYELNEFQDILRVQSYRALKEGVAATLNPGSNDDGYKCEGGVGANIIAVKAGTLFCDGIPVVLENDTTFSGLTTYGGGGTRTDLIYLGVSEVEIADPNQVPQLGETSRRQQLTVTIGCAAGTSLPVDSPEPIWEGGIRYFLLATITRATGVGTIAPEDVEDNRYRLPAYIIDLITHQYPQSSGRPPIVLGNWFMSVGDGVNTFGDVNSSGGINGIRRALDVCSDLGVTAVTIFLKHGDYAVDGDPSHIVTSMNVTIIGESPLNTRIIDNYPAADAGVINDSAKLELRNLSIHGGSGTPEYGVKGRGLLTLDNVEVIDCKVLLESFAADGGFRARHLLVDLSAAVVAGSPITIDDSGQFYTGGGAVPTELPGYEVESCTLRCNPIGGDPAIGLVPYEDVTDRTLGEMRIRATTFMLGGTDSLVTVDNNPGVFGMAVATTVTGKLQRIPLVEFIDCKVYANASETAINSVLLYQPRNPVSRFVIRGGEWKSPALTSNSSPFYLAPAYKYPTADDFGDAAATEQSIEVLDVDMGWAVMVDSTATFDSYGNLSGDLVRVASQPTFIDAFVFSAERVTVQNLKVVGGIGNSDIGDVLVAGKWCKVDGVDLGRPASGAGGALPDHRMRVSFGTPVSPGSRCSVANVQLSYPTASPFSPVSGSNPIIDASACDSSSGLTTVQDCHFMNVTSTVGVDKGAALNMNVRVHHCSVNGDDITDDGTALLNKSNVFTLGPQEVDDASGAAAIVVRGAPGDIAGGNLYKPIEGFSTDANTYWESYVGEQGAEYQFVMTLNAVWDVAAQHWLKDDNGRDSIAILWDQDVGFKFVRKPPGAGTWTVWPATSGDVQVGGTLFASAVSATAGLSGNGLNIIAGDATIDGNTYANDFQYNAPVFELFMLPLSHAGGMVTIYENLYADGFIAAYRSTVLDSGDMVMWPIAIAAGCHIGEVSVRHVMSNTVVGANDKFSLIKRTGLTGNWSLVDAQTAAGAAGAAETTVVHPGGDETVAANTEYALRWEVFNSDLTNGVHRVRAIQVQMMALAPRSKVN